MAEFRPGGRTYLILGIIFLLTVGTVIFIVQYKTNGIVTELMLDRVEISNSSFNNYLTELKERLADRAQVIASNQNLISTMKKGDYEALRGILFSLSLGIDFVTICDSNGIVVVRSHSDLKGDDNSTRGAVRNTLATGSGSTSMEVVESNGKRLSLYSCVPIYEEGVIIGVVSCNYDLTKNDYVDGYKTRTGNESTIFLFDTRISSTITDKFGNRITGTKPEEIVIKTVLEQQKEYYGIINLYDKQYGGCYFPILSDGEVIAMAFTGVDINSTIKKRHSMNLWIILASCLGAAASVFILVFSGIITQKYNRHSERQLRQQKLMADISRSFLSDTAIDTLITNTLRITGEFLELSRLLFFMLEDDGVTLTCRNEWINPKLGMKTHIGFNVKLKESIIAMIKNLPSGAGIESCLHSDDPVSSKVMAEYRIEFRNFITTPVFVKGEMIGAVDFSKWDNTRKWDESEVSLATHLASTLSSVFEREAMGRQTSIVENSPHMIFYSDPGGHMVYANPAVTAVTGYSLAELRSEGFTLLFDEHSVRDIKEIYVPRTQQKNIVNHEIILKCRDCSKHILDVTSFLMKDGMTAAICIDITEMRTMEAELINAKNKADQASRAKSEFLSKMSHEMRTPMNAIIGMAMIARNTEDYNRKEYALGKVEEASTHLLGIINDILDMMKIEANKLELSPVEFNLKNMVQKAVSFVSFRMEEKRQRFSLDIGGDVPFFFTGDDQRLTQVVTNLLSNAVKFTGEDGEIKFNVSLLEENSGICELRFEVADSGIGISPEQQKKLFQAFEQAESGITRKYGGTGLGLVISKRIIELMGGQISIESEAGKGSSFIFTVKLTRTLEKPVLKPADEDISANRADNENGTPEFEGKKLLLAEDIEINREILISLLDGRGLIIDTAENGKEALEKIIAAPDSYDLVFMDMQMPEMDGLEATRSIRTLNVDIPIIAMTANVFKDDIANCLAAGMNDHIGKPIEMDKVLEKLRKYL